MREWGEWRADTKAGAIRRPPVPPIHSTPPQDVDLPPPEPITPDQEELLTIWTRLETAWRESPCNLRPSARGGGSTAAVDGGLADVLTLHASVFPAELFSRADADAAAARAGAPGAQAVFWRSAANWAAAAEAAGGALFERLEALERQGGGGDPGEAGTADAGPDGGGDGPSATPAAPPAATGEGDDDPGAGADDTDGDDPDADDDYLVGEAFDDDEEYGDDDDGEAEPTY